MMSSTFDQPGYEAVKANDGDSKTRWASAFESERPIHINEFQIFAPQSP